MCSAMMQIAEKKAMVNFYIWSIDICHDKIQPVLHNIFKFMLRDIPAMFQIIYYIFSMWNGSEFGFLFCQPTEHTMHIWLMSSYINQFRKLTSFCWIGVLLWWPGPDYPA